MSDRPRPEPGLIGRDVTLRFGCGGSPGQTGRVIAYSDAPQLLIETPTGERIWWRIDLSDYAEESK